MEDIVFLNGQPVDAPHENHHHVSPMWMYVAVFVALVFLTVLTYAVSFANLGPMSLIVAMMVATVKASLVIAFFMHLAFEDRFFLFIFCAAFVAISIFFGVILGDMSTAKEVHDESGLGIPRIEADVAATESDLDVKMLPPPSREHLFQ